MDCADGDDEVARPREFDEKMAIRLMTHTFWERGYQATSTRDLEVVTGLTTGSLYKAFGSKNKIMTRCLDYYMGAQSYLSVLSRNESAPLLDAISAVLDTAIESIDPKPGRAPGCLVTNLATELVHVEPDLGRDVSQRLNEMQQALRLRLQRAQRESELSKNVDPDTASAHLMVVLQGMLVMAATTKDRDSMQRTRDFTLAMLH